MKARLILKKLGAPQAGGGSDGFLALGAARRLPGMVDPPEKILEPRIRAHAAEHEQPVRLQPD